MSVSGCSSGSSGSTTRAIAGRAAAGLGLAIVREVVRAHDGEITLEDSPLGGLRAEIRFPRGQSTG